MSERIYTEYPELYDAIQSDWDYDRDVQFVSDALNRRAISGDRLLEVGCGTGEHTRRFVDRGYDVTAIDRYDGMLEVACRKCDPDFRQSTLPDISVEGPFDVIVAIRGVVNHLAPDELGPALEALGARLAKDGVLVFDNSPLPSNGNEPALDRGISEHGRYARVVVMSPSEGDRVEWNSVVFLEEEDCFRNSRLMTPFEDEEILEMLTSRSLTVETHDGFGPDDSRTVFVAQVDGSTDS